MTVFERLHMPFERLHLPSLGGATDWLNSEPLGPAELQGRPDCRLYQLVRQRDVVRERTLEIAFLAPGAEAYSFTFG